jgi:FkbM family methyltransferase
MAQELLRRRYDKRENFRESIIMEVAKRVKSYTLSSLPAYTLDCVGFNAPAFRRVVLARRLIYRLRSGVSFTVRPFTFDRCIVDEVFLNQVYTPHNIFDVNDGDVVVDLGAHIGVFTVFAARRARNVAIYSYEPRPDNFRLLCENVRLNGLRDCVKVFEFAVSASAENRQFVMDSEGLGKIGETEGRSILVPVVTVKDVFDSNSLSRVNFLKVDVEGEERSVLLNLPTEYLSRIDRISMECHSPEITSELASHLRHHSFDVTTSRGGHPDLYMLYARNLLVNVAKTEK